VTDSLPVLPKTSFDERRVAVGWDASTWSRLYVNFHPLVYLNLIDCAIQAIIFGYEIIAVVANASIRSPSSD
jgi:hypothetical protein